MTEGLGLADQAPGVALVPDRRHLAEAGSGRDEGARKQFSTDLLGDSIRLARQQRFVQGEPPGLDGDPVCDQLIPGEDPDQVAGYDLAREQLDLAALPNGSGSGCDQQSESVEDLLRLQLLADPDPGVEDRDQSEDRVCPETEGEDQDEEHPDDRVEQGEDVPGDDTGRRSRGRELLRSELPQPSRSLVVIEAERGRPRGRLFGQRAHAADSYLMRGADPRASGV